jgi:cation diffusion facilitator family transporter
MHIHSLEEWKHNHDFVVNFEHAEKSAARVMMLTAVMMVAEVISGTAFGSMALLADGWHMATHVAAFGITLFSYRYARNHATDQRFTFGTGKVSVLGGFASAVALAVVALIMALESVLRMLEPQEIHFNEAIGVAIVGLIVNLVSGLMLQGHHAHEHDHEHEGHAHDHNLRAAYLHVLADALTSILAIVALALGKYFGWMWPDPVMGLVGAFVITRWSYHLMSDTSSILLDGIGDTEAMATIQIAIEQDSDNRVADLHVWYVGPHHLSAAVSVVTHEPKSPEYYKSLLHGIPALAHVLIEVNPCHGMSCLKSAG